MVNTPKSLAPSITNARSQQQPFPTPPTSRFPVTGLFLATERNLKGWLSTNQLFNSDLTVAACCSLRTGTVKGRYSQIENYTLLLAISDPVVEKSLTLAPPLYLFTLLPTLNFLLLLLYLRFAPWYVLYGVTALLFGLAKYYPALYLRVWDIPIILFGIILLWIFLELFVVMWLMFLYEWRGMNWAYYLFNYPPGNGLFIVCLFNRMHNNRHAARRLLSYRFPDALASGLMLLLSFLV